MSKNAVEVEVWHCGKPVFGDTKELKMVNDLHNEFSLKH